MTGASRARHGEGWATRRAEDKAPRQRDPRNCEGPEQGQPESSRGSVADGSWPVASASCVLLANAADAGLGACAELQSQALKLPEPKHHEKLWDRPRAGRRSSGIKCMEAGLQEDRRR